ncbi:MAG: threonine synthase [Deltaproteobacteria bacterium]|nr:threonine synthase [Deltaproteobacteria bacterium]
MAYNGIILKYQRYLPVKAECVISLNEGNTPLLPAPRLAKIVGEGVQVYLKLEGLNPTGSFKDRGMTYAVSKAVEAGSKAVICASTGNTSAAAAAYAARAGIRCYVLIPKGKIALGKLTQALIHGARVVEVDGNFDEALTIVRQIAEQGLATLVNSVNPYRLEGQRTASFEVCEALGRAPTHHVLPVGNAGNITAYWRGYREYRSEGVIDTLPKMLGFQAAGAAPIVLGKPIKKPETIATAIRIGNPASWKQALQARDESGGLIDKVTDREILKAYHLLAETEGYFCEPASAASVAGLLKHSKNGMFQKGDVVVCTLTGHGLKDPDSAIKNCKKPLVVKPNFEKVLKALKL